MALYLPKQHLVIEVVDDPESAPIDPDAFPELSVATVTVDQLANPRTIGWPGAWKPRRPKGTRSGAPKRKWKRRAEPRNRGCPIEPPGGGARHPSGPAVA